MPCVFSSRISPLGTIVKRVCFVGDFLQIKLCHPRLVCATKTSLDSSSCNLTKVSGTADSSAELNHSLENLQFVCQSKVRHLIMGSIYKNVLLLFLAWSPFKEKKKGNELHVPWSSESCWGFCTSYIAGRCDSLVMWSCSCMCLTSLDIWSPSTPRRSQHSL